MDQYDGKARAAGRLPAAKGKWRAPANRNGFKRRQIAEVDFFERIVHRCKLRRRGLGAERDHSAKDYDNDRNQTPGKDEKHLHRRLSLPMSPSTGNAACCACAESGQPAAAPPRILMKSRRRMGPPTEGLLRASKDSELPGVSQGYLDRLASA